MGRRSSTESLANVLLAFLESRTWRQAELARRVGVERKQIVKILTDLQDAGLRLDRDDRDRPQVYWSVPKNWFPGAVAFRGEQLRELVRLLQLAPTSERREQLLDHITSTATGINWPRSNSVQTRALNTAEEAGLAALQRAAGTRESVRVRYYTLSRGEMAWRFLSVHRLLVDQGRFVATCHRDNRLKWFRLDGVIAVESATVEPFRNVADEELRCLLDESVDGYHSGTPAVLCVFRVRNHDARWVKGQLPLPADIQEDLCETTFTARTAGLLPLARFLVGLGSAVRVDTPELRALIVELAQGALSATQSTSGILNISFPSLTGTAR